MRKFKYYNPKTNHFSYLTAKQASDLKKFNINLIFCDECVNNNGGEILPNFTYPGLFVPLSWEGTRTSEYVSAFPLNTPSVYNTLARDTDGVTFDNTIRTVQTFSSEEDFYFGGDSISGATSNSFLVGISESTNTGIGFADIDYALYANGLNMTPMASGVAEGTPETVPNGLTILWSWMFEYKHATNELNLYINNNIIHTFTTSYSNELISIRFDGRNTINTLGRHIAAVSGSLPNKLILNLGDSITFGRAAEGQLRSSYVENYLAYINNSYFSFPMIAVSGNTSADVVNNQLPIAVDYFNNFAGTKLANLMIGINDLRDGIPLATIQNNITNIVSTLQGIGVPVVINTVSRDFNTDHPNRYPLNAWILANSIGADYVVDHTNSDIETNPALYELDLLHPNPSGMQDLAYNWALEMYDKI